MKWLRTGPLILVFQGELLIEHSERLAITGKLHKVTGMGGLGSSTTLHEA